MEVVPVASAQCRLIHRRNRLSAHQYGRLTRRIERCNAYLFRLPDDGVRRQYRYRDASAFGFCYRGGQPIGPAPTTYVFAAASRQRGVLRGR